MPFEPAKILVWPSSSMTAYSLRLFPTCIQFCLMSEASMPSPSSSTMSWFLENTRVTCLALASYAFFTSSNTADSSLVKFWTPSNSAIVLSSTTYCNCSKSLPPNNIEIVNVLTGDSYWFSVYSDSDVLHIFEECFAFKYPFSIL